MKGFTLQNTFLFLSLVQSTLSQPEKGQQLDSNKTTCLMSLHDAEVSVKNNPYNLESIDDGFFPSNTPPSVWVIVNYYFNETNSIKVHPAAYEATGTKIKPDLSFQWVASPVFEYFGPSVIHKLSFVFGSLSQTVVDIVIDPICGNELNKELLMLKKLSAKLQMLSSVESDYHRSGVITLLHIGNETKASNGINGKGILVCILLAQYYLCLSWIFLVPVLLCKLQLLPIAQGVKSDAGQEKVCLFFGILFATALSMIYIFYYDCELFKLLHTRNGFSMAAAATFPIPATVFIVVDLIFTVRSISGTEGIPRYLVKTKADERCSNCAIAFHVFASVVLMLFLQQLSFRIGWLALMLVTFPARVGLQCVHYIIRYLAATLVISGWIQGIVACTNSGRIRSREMYGGSYALTGLSFIMLAYYATVTMSGVGYQDGLSAIMPSLFPIIAVGLLAWILSGFRRRIPGTEGTTKILKVMWQEATNGIGKYYEKELRDLPV